jgi:hypothetical protein
MRKQKCNVFRISSDLTKDSNEVKDCPNNIQEFYIPNSEIINLLDDKSVQNISEQK